MRSLLVLYCGAGGAAAGYARAGFDVTGVDNRPQPRFPFRFVLDDALSVPLAGYDAIHASPPCHDHSKSLSLNEPDGTGWMLAATRTRLQLAGVPWVIENVPGAPMRADYRLCGCMFGLGVRRERWFETSWHGFDLVPGHDHREHAVTIYGHGGSHSHMRSQRGAYVDLDAARAAIGIGWMNTKELSQAIPPAYTQYIGRRLRAVLAETEGTCRK